jgi:hypothetical protein
MALVTLAVGKSRHSCGAVDDPIGSHAWTVRSGTPPMTARGWSRLPARDDRLAIAVADLRAVLEDLRAACARGRSTLARACAPVTEPSDATPRRRASAAGARLAMARIVKRIRACSYRG